MFLFVSMGLHAALLSLDYRDAFEIQLMSARGAVASTVQVIIDGNSKSTLSQTTASADEQFVEEAMDPVREDAVQPVDSPMHSDAGEGAADTVVKHVAEMATMAIAQEVQQRPRQPSRTSGTRKDISPDKNSGRIKVAQAERKRPGQASITPDTRKDTGPDRKVSRTQTHSRRAIEESPTEVADDDASTQPARRQKSPQNEDGVQEDSGPEHGIENAHADVLAVLRSALAKHFYYPKLARKRNLSGQVLLGFTLKSDGRIQSVHVVKGSGYGILDRAAVSALEKIGKVETQSIVLSKRALDLELPVWYQLQ